MTRFTHTELAASLPEIHAGYFTDGIPVSAMALHLIWASRYTATQDIEDISKAGTDIERYAGNL